MPVGIGVNDGIFNMYMRKKGHAMKKILKITGMTLLALIILAFGAFYTWSRFTYGPSEALKNK